VGKGGYAAIDDDSVLLNQLLGSSALSPSSSSPSRARATPSSSRGGRGGRGGGRGGLGDRISGRRHYGDDLDNDNDEENVTTSLPDSQRVTDNVGNAMLRPLIERIFTDKLVETESINNKTYQCKYLTHVASQPSQSYVSSV
jgi:hypothetical protein